MTDVFTSKVHRSYKLRQHFAFNSNVKSNKNIDNANSMESIKKN